MSALLDALLEERRRGALEYQAYLAKLLEQAEKLGKGETDTVDPDWADNRARRTLIDFGWPDPNIPVKIDEAILTHEHHEATSGSTSSWPKSTRIAWSTSPFTR